ncbi:Hypothetical predicted protein [Olea europaea subsp. europaea]|uniref:Uncharacterized protein n=1 Tax=Olea europaea subsp. europaea TaxID=158383 RepID=A0A8S0VJJ3_OLEEU|nr:Hypothetical predicted protein [Olea europaea subsp. europaea]
MLIVCGSAGSDSGSDSEKHGSGFPGFSSHPKGIDATSLTGSTTGLIGRGIGFQSFLGVPGFSSQTNGTEIGSVSLPVRTLKRH